MRSGFSYPNQISLSDHVIIGPGCNLVGAGVITVGQGSIIALEVCIHSRTHNFDCDLMALPFDNVMFVSPVVIGEYVWIGARVIIFPGVNIGNGAAIGAGAVVARSVPECAVVVGNPARIVRYRDKDRFDAIRREAQPFVYARLGRDKVFKDK